MQNKRAWCLIKHVLGNLRHSGLCRFSLNFFFNCKNVLGIKYEEKDLSCSPCKVLHGGAFSGIEHMSQCLSWSGWLKPGEAFWSQDQWRNVVGLCSDWQQGGPAALGGGTELGLCVTALRGRSPGRPLCLLNGTHCGVESCWHWYRKHSLYRRDRPEKYAPYEENQR